MRPNVLVGRGVRLVIHQFFVRHAACQYREVPEGTVRGTVLQKSREVSEEESGGGLQ